MCEAMLNGGYSLVPIECATCPECGAQLMAESTEWIEETGQPTTGGINVDCLDDPDLRHRYWQSDWQDVVDRVEKWAGAVEN